MFPSREIATLALAMTRGGGLCAILATIYIISFPGDVSTSLNMTIGCGCPTRVITREQSDRGNPADRRTHQADNLAKLRQEFFILA